MSGSPTIQRITSETLEEHRQIHFYLDQIAVSLRTLGDDPTDVEPMRRLGAQIEGLKERLVEHHQTEEDGVFQAMLDVMPDCRVEVNRLINQHEKMIDILEMARIHAHRGEASEAGGLCTDMQSFLEMFRRHEHDEEQLIRRTIEREARSLD